MRGVALTCGDELHPPASEVPTRERDQAALAHVLCDEKVREVPPPHALNDDLFLHELVAHGTAACAFNDEIVARSGVPRRVSDDALDVVTHLFRGDLIGNRKWQEIRCDHRHDRNGVKIEELEAGVTLVDMMD